MFYPYKKIKSVYWDLRIKLYQLKEKLKVYKYLSKDSDGSIKITTRVIFYILGIVLGIFINISFYENILLFLVEEEKLANNDIFNSALFILLFVLPGTSIHWFIKTLDRKKDFENSFFQQNETIYSNALNLISKDNNLLKSIGLREIINLKNNNRISSERINSGDIF